MPTMSDSVLLFTLDTNCLVDLEEGRSDAQSVRALADAHRAGKARVAAVFSSASENPQPERTDAANLTDFQLRLARLDLAHLETVAALGIWDFSFWDGSLWGDDAGKSLQDQIQAILFPAFDFSCARPFDRKWRNAMCDVQMIWAHIHYRRDVFVTSDGNFHKAAKHAALVTLGAGRIVSPAEAAALLA
jgi:hypothetical protein